MAALEVKANISTNATVRSLLGSILAPTAVLFNATGQILIDTMTLNSSVITYTNIDLNVGNGIDVKTGTFKVPVGGLYAILFKGTAVNNNSRFDVYLSRNNELTLSATTISRNGIITLTLSTVMRLFTNEVLSIVIYRDVNYFNNTTLQAQFSGYLLMALGG